MSSLTPKEQAYHNEVMSEAKASLYDPRTVNARLLQARDTITVLNSEIVKSLDKGIPENSEYIKVCSEKIAALFKQVDELNALAGESKSAA
jgi:hypothetical protein